MDEDSVMGVESTGVPDGLQLVILGGMAETDRSGSNRRKSGNGRDLRPLGFERPRFLCGAWETNCKKTYIKE